MKNRSFFLLSVFFLWGALLFGGDKAEFVNLGFSPDGGYFFFGQYGFAPGSSKTYADLYMVNTVSNKFVPGGVLSSSYNGTIEPGQSADGALFTLLEGAGNLRRQYRIDYMRKGRPLYIRIDDEDSFNLRNLAFRDFETKADYTLELVETINRNWEGQAVNSSFYIRLVYRRNGFERTYSVGHPNYLRSGVAQYRIERVLADPMSRGIVILIAKIDNDLNVRYMVETFRLPQ